jgi:hypothetical protein
MKESITKDYGMEVYSMKDYYENNSMKDFSMEDYYSLKDYIRKDTAGRITA